MITNKKAKKLFRDPKLFFKDFFFKRKHKINNSITIDKSVKGKHSFVVIAPTYNVEKYIEDFFNSIRNQTLSFENNLHIMFVDDGSTDNTAEIIKKLCKKYPRNITYLYKDNGGLSSSRNFGLDYIDDNNLPFDYLTFTDPDDILDKNYFLELDKFFTNHPSCQIASCNLIYYYESNNMFKDIHPLKYRYNQSHVVKSADFKDDILLSAATAVYKTSLLRDVPIRFDEKLKPSFEDCKFNNKLIVSVPDIQVGFVKESKYFYRQREDNSSLMNGSWGKVGLFTTVLSDGVLSILKFAKYTLGYVPLHIQRVALFHCIGYYRRLINAGHHIDFLSDEEKKKFDKLLFEVFSYIDEETIIKCAFPNIQQKHKIGLLSLYKNKRYPISYVYINRIDVASKVINFSFFTGFRDDVLTAKLDNVNRNIIEDKLICNEFLSHNFFYERRFTLNYDNITQTLELSINNKKVNLTSFTKAFTGGDKISTLIECMQKKFIFPTIKNSWVIMDRKDKGDDNAEHFYRYLMKNHPEEQIFFAISKDSSDWNRLENDGFNLLDFGSGQFMRELKQCKYIVSSHLFIWNCLTNLKGLQSLTNKRKIWLQHGVICNDNSNVVNTKEIDLMVTSTVAERGSIVNPFTKYNLLPSQVILTGLPRHDALLEKAKNTKEEKLILVMPTWRTWLNQDNILDSEYFKRWNDLLSSEKLNKLLELKGYKLIFAPHKELSEHISKFYNSNNVTIWNGDNESMQELFVRAEAMITDYSSVAFEMGFLNKTVFYFQFDQNEFFSKHYQKGYFDFYNDGFGPVSDDLDNLLDEIGSYLDNQEKNKESYHIRMNIFSNKNGNSSKKIYEEIKRLR
ncbi:CDP-glycerol glycerophosphotransferase family protein [Mannheimia haemolytica]|uniref:CDP-glycerol glycerophosphotransferase family protein n=1 Tax=Mannheimia haemolytica TaxID=75985 RepID=UPI001CF5312D|nr:CDP-glycerol glycerophosphotransferase family protein [Mannheimia haemolytica]MCB4226944.1 bifunctional glycosyltransferase family 2 protein/CDP-glycerol:glycerophosphate glycerophosphotransferase [Mannheimia haemolytica]